MGGFGKTRVVAMHQLAFVDFDTRDRRAQLQPGLGIEADFTHFANAFHIHEQPGFAHRVAHLDQQVGASADHPRTITVGCEQLDCLIDRGGSLVTELVQSSLLGGPSPLDF